MSGPPRRSRGTRLDGYGEEYLDQVREADASYGEILGLTQAKPYATPAPAIRDALNSLREAVRFYARRVVGLADEEDPSSIELVQAALAPLLEAQAEARQRRGASELEPEPQDEGELPLLPANVEPVPALTPL